MPVIFLHKRSFAQRPSYAPPIYTGAQLIEAALLDLKFRMADACDIDALAQLRWNLCTDDQVSDAIAQQHFAAQFRTALSDINDQSLQVHLVAELNDMIISVMSIVRVHKIPAPDELDGEWGYLTNVYTRMEWRNHGIGQQLLEYAKQWATATGLELMAVWPSDRSFPFYQRGGFQRAPDPLVWKPVDAK